jgi:L-aspartate oxidase
VLLLAKERALHFHAQSTQGGLAALLSDEDEVSLHLQDTLRAGDGLCNPAAVKILVEEGPERIEELIAWGAQFDRNGTKLVFAREGTLLHRRILHAQGESTRREVLRALCAKGRSLKNTSLVESAFATSLHTKEGRVTGVSLLDGKGAPHDIACSAVLLATGGMGQLYRYTTNSQAATADGVALALQAGAEISDLEFVQFHPTALCAEKAPRFPLPDELRTEGAHLRNIELNRFMGKYHPMGELAPRDVVARAIIHEMEVSRAKDPFVYLDLTHLDAAKVRKRFPHICSACMQHNIDLTEDLIPVRPAAHFAMGGVRTDLYGKTNVPGLYAAGEVAATGAHGANRLPGNALLEGLVYGARAGRAMRETARTALRAAAQPQAACSNRPVDAGVQETIAQIQDLTWNDVGVVRTRTGLEKALNALEEIAPRLAHPWTRRAYEAAHLHLTALSVARGALAREESRGAHYRSDCPHHEDRKFLKHSVIRSDRVAFA